MLFKSDGKILAIWRTFGIPDILGTNLVRRENKGSRSTRTCKTTSTASDFRYSCSCGHHRTNQGLPLQYVRGNKLAFLAFRHLMLNNCFSCIQLIFNSSELYQTRDPNKPLRFPEGKEVRRVLRFKRSRRQLRLERPRGPWESKGVPESCLFSTNQWNQLLLD